MASLQADGRLLYLLCSSSMRIRYLLVPVVVALAAKAGDRIDLIEFFGYQGMPVETVRQALRIREGGDFDNKMRAQVREAVKSVTGGDVTDIASVCCNESGHHVLFIGLPGESTRTFRLNAKPVGTARLPAGLLALFAKVDEAISAAIKKGGDAPQEDDSEGYALIHYPPGRTLQLQLRDYTREHEAQIYDVLENSSDGEQRSRAAIAIGYAQRSAQQIAALVRASRDSDAGVRDEATRAIGVLLRADASLAKKIPAADFIEMAASGVWMDRNKASMVLNELTRSRDPQLLTQIESQAWAPLLEMARWRDMGHASIPRLILGRIRGIPEERLTPLALGAPEAFLGAIGTR
jgi:hypothetical protein